MATRQAKSKDTKEKHKELKMQLNTPSKDDIKRIDEIWESKREVRHYTLETNALDLLFNQYKSNTNLTEIILKIGCLDNFYSTNATKNVKIPDIAEKIISINDFDLRLQKWDTNLVRELAIFSKGDKEIKLYSFATKYCALHNCMVYKRDNYAIFDSIVCKKLKEFNKQYKFAEFSNDDFELENYPKYVEILDKFRKRFALNCTFRELDLYLWKMGKLEKLENN